MTSNGEWPSSRNAYTPFEEELVNAMKDFANSADAPDFAPATVMRSARRRARPMVIAGITAFFILAGGGTALAVTASHTGSAGLHDRPVSATSHPAKGCGPSATATPIPATAAPVPATPVPVATSHPAKGCSASAAATPVPIASQPGNGANPPATAAPVPVATSHPRSATTPLVPATSSPEPVASRPGGGSAPSATSLPTPAASPAHQ